MSSTRSQLKALAAQKIISGNSNTTAQNVRDYESEATDSNVNKTDDKDAADGYLSINSQGNANFSLIKTITPSGAFLRDDGAFIPIDFVMRSGQAITMASDVSNYSYSGPSISTWILPPIQGNKKYTIFNRGGGNLTLNYPVTGNLIYDLQNAALVNSYVVPDSSAVIIIDDGTYLIINAT